MGDMKNQEYFEKESREFFTDDEFSSIENNFLNTNQDFMQKISEINLLYAQNSKVALKWKEAYQASAKVIEMKDAKLEDTIKELEKETAEKNELKGECKKLNDEKSVLENERDSAVEEKYKLKEQIEELKKDLSEEENHWGILKESLQKLNDNYEQFYQNEKSEKERVKSELEQKKNELRETQKMIEGLQSSLNEEKTRKEEKEKEVNSLNVQLSTKNNQVNELNEINEKYKSQKEKMPALMKLYNAYNDMMESRNVFPKVFWEHLQNVVPTDDFDRFLIQILRSTYPKSFHASISACVERYSNDKNQISDEAMKKVLIITNKLLSEIFEFGNAYFKEERFIRNNIEVGDLYDEQSCYYIGKNGRMFGNIVNVYFQGFQDEKNNKIYCSYVEGES